MTFEFKPWGKTQRYSGLTITITEKIDGTNACIVIQQGELLGCQSRNRIITTESDNMGFANWVEQNKCDLEKLGDGYHYGEWAGPGIQSNPHKFEEKKFLLFNTLRPQESLPSCVELVPVLYEGAYQGKEHINNIMEELWSKGKVEGYKPEGIIVYFHQHRKGLKYTFEGNKSKWELGEK